MTAYNENENNVNPDENTNNENDSVNTDETDNENDSDYDDMSDDEKKAEAIAFQERLFDDEYYVSLERNNTYYISIPCEYRGGFLTDLHISSRGFFTNSIISIENYIRNYTNIEIPQNTNLEIVKTSYTYDRNGFYTANVLVKTFWLRLVQRRWRNVLKQRRENIWMQQREMSGPKLRGCLADMKK